MVATVQGCLRWLVRWSYRPDEPGDERFRKNLLVPLLMIAVLTVFPSVTYVKLLATRIHASTVTAGCVAMLSYIAVTKSCSTRLAEAIILWLSVVYYYLVDFRTYGSLDGWSTSVLAMDLLLLCQTRATVVGALRNLTVVYITLRTLDQSYDFGIYDSLPQLGPVDKPPSECKLGAYAGGYLLFVRLQVFIADFLMTRYFAYSMQAEQARIKSSVELAEKVAAALVRFDLDLAENALQKSDAGEPLHEALFSLLHNLRSYRPYLPEAIFDMGVGESGESGSGCLSPRFNRGPPQGVVAMAFTDIQSSTALWEACPAAMRKAMHIHNRLIRRCLHEFRGYEVKTIGDAFMVAFDNVNDAVGFCLSAQEALYKSSEWPEDLMRQPLCQHEEGLWNGLLVRMGVHVGEMDTQLNPVTERYDYCGQNVNIASRVEGAAWGGTVAVTAAAFSGVDLKHLHDPSMVMLGGLCFKGVSERMDVYLLAPRTLEARVDRRYAAIAKRDDVVVETVSSPTTPLRGGHTVRMRGTCGTVNTVRVDYSFLDGVEDCSGPINQLISAVLDSVERTNGMLVTVSSSSIVAGWNFGRQRVYGHATQAALSAGLLYRSFSTSFMLEHITLGIATGDVLHGTVGTDSQRFVLAVGQCLEMGGELAVAANMLGAFAVVGAMPGHSSIADDLTARRITRRLGTWELWNGPVDVFQLRVERMGEWARGDDDDEDEEWGWSSGFASAVQSRDVSLLRHYSADDGVLLRVAQAITDGFHPRKGIAQSVTDFYR